MYKYTFKMFLAELLAISFGMSIGFLVIVTGWYAFGLRGGEMMAWTVISALIATLPFFAAISLRS